MKVVDIMKEKHEEYVKSYNFELNKLRDQIELFKRSSLVFKFYDSIYYFRI